MATEPSAYWIVTDALSGVATPAGGGHGDRDDALGGAAEPVGEVEEVARLAEDSAAALVRVVQPVVGRDSGAFMR